MIHPSFSQRIQGSWSASAAEQPPVEYLPGLPPLLQHITDQTLNQTVTLHERACEHLKDKIQVYAFELGILLGAPTDKLLAIRQPQLNRGAQMLEKILEAALPLTMNRLLASVTRITHHHSGVVLALKKLAGEHGLEKNTLISAELLPELMLPLLGLKRYSHGIGLHLGLPIHQLDIIEADTYHQGDCVALLRKTLVKVPGLSIKKLLRCLHEIDDPALAERLEHWAQTKGVAPTAPLSKALTEQITTQFMVERAPRWFCIGMRLGIDLDRMHRWEQKVSKKPTLFEEITTVLKLAEQHAPLTRKRILLALGYMGEKKLASELKEIWGVEPQLAVPAPSAEQLWERLLLNDQYYRNLQPQLVHMLLEPATDNHNWIAMTFNLEPSFSYVSFGEQLAIAILQADTQGTLTLDNLAWICSELELLPASVCFRSKPDRNQSKLLQWQDVARLAGHQSSSPRLTAAICTGLLLDFRVTGRELEPISVWADIMRQFPVLQTEHLRQLFSQHPVLCEYIADLPDQSHSPPRKAKCGGIRPLSRSLAGLAAALESNPDLLQWLHKAEMRDNLPCQLPPVFQVLYYALGDQENMDELFTRLETYVRKDPAGSAATAHSDLQLSKKAPPAHYTCTISLELMTEDPIVIPVSKQCPPDKIHYCYFSKKQLLQALEASARIHPATGESVGVHPLSRDLIPIAEIRRWPVNTELRDDIRQWQVDHLNY